jgi:GLPGLI family protein
LILSQTTGIIVYNFSVLEDEKILKNEIIGRDFRKTIDAAKYAKFTLTFNDSISEFKNIQNMSLDGQNIELALSISGVVKEIYTFKGTIYRNNSSEMFGENEYLIIEPLNKNWVLTSESKKIDGYTCYKATNEYVVDNGKIFRHPVVAWFCPEIPIPYGPKGYGGLPGLILELQEWNIVFGAEKINLSNEDKLIILPTKGQTITNQEFNKKMRGSVRKKFE